MGRHQGLVGLIGLAVVTSACAAAGSSANPHLDASGREDGPHLDGHVSPMDAPSQSGVCTSTATCATAVSLGTVSGDTGATSVSATGYQAAWYVLRVTEDDSGPFGAPMMLLTQITSPSSEEYDAFVYVNTGSDVPDCTTAVGTAIASGMTSSTDVVWGETGTFANDSDDSRSVSIEIRPKPGTCSAAQPWHLTVTGDS